MYILSIESSCDETSVAVCKEREVLSNIVATQIAEHALYGGVVPEIASRRHCESISEVCEQALTEAGIWYKDLGAIAVTFAPGLIGALLVGVNFAKGLAKSLNIPLIPVHHLRSHIAANYITHKELEPEFLCLLVSGGNSHIIKVEDYCKFNVIGRTRDDAAGECFDKTARALGLPYPGGVKLDKIAEDGNPDTYPLPYPKVEGAPYDFSFSGLKTAVINIIHNAGQKGEEINIPDMAAAVRRRVCEIATANTMLALNDTGIKTLVVAGGVSANSLLRRMLQEECEKRGIKLYLPELKYCGDNAAMVGVQAYYEYKNGNVSDMSLNATATLPIDYNN